jgi:hypothetical protein
LIDREMGSLFHSRRHKPGPMPCSWARGSLLHIYKHTYIYKIIITVNINNNNKLYLLKRILIH